MGVKPEAFIQSSVWKMRSRLRGDDGCCAFQLNNARTAEDMHGNDYSPRDREDIR